jgi:hypothetical protein
MLQWLLIALLILHGLIHFMGLGKAYGGMAALKRPVSKPMGWLWALSAALFVLSATLRLLHADTWWMPAMPAVLISQALIIRHWSDARFGTIANIVIAAAIALGMLTWSFRRAADASSHRAIAAAHAQAARTITEADLAALPQSVQRFLRVAGAVGSLKPKVLRIDFEGEIRSKDGPWMPFTSTQVNTFDTPTRSFWMDATMKGMPTKGWHHYEDGRATMLIKLLGAIPVLDVSGPELDTTETVTWFNDLCLYSPAALIDPRITWNEIDDHSAEATFAHKGIVVRATLVFDPRHRLIDFISEDRSYLEDDGSMTHRRFSTPVSEHAHINGALLPSYGEAVWQLSDGPFTYGRFRLKRVSYQP